MHRMLNSAEEDDTVHDTAQYMRIWTDRHYNIILLIRTTLMSRNIRSLFYGAFKAWLRAYSPGRKAYFTRQYPRLRSVDEMLAYTEN